MSARERGQLGPERVIDVQFDEFHKGTVKALQKFYDHFGLTLHKSVAERMQGFPDSGSESERHGAHTYSLNDSGLDLSAERVRFAEYQKAYTITTEVKENAN
jgi:hypothetical protein